MTIETLVPDKIVLGRDNVKRVQHGLPLDVATNGHEEEATQETPNVRMAQTDRPDASDRQYRGTSAAHAAAKYD